jgi:hypothetical protein
MFSGIRAIPLIFEEKSCASMVMPGQQPNMPCTHRQQLSRHKRLGYCLISYRLMTEVIYTLIWTWLDGTIDDYMKEIKDKHYYIEVQLWNNDCNI